ncbi:MAG: hypothetical protein Q8N26_01345, partial [Myxococcales bacterium]|nr:hypothetical protein [Myxococcales bacterium]
AGGSAAGGSAAGGSAAGGSAAGGSAAGGSAAGGSAAGGSAAGGTAAGGTAAGGTAAGGSAAGGSAAGGSAAGGSAIPTEFVVVRVGDGNSPLTTDATAVFLERRAIATGALVSTLPLPTATAATNLPFTLVGTASPDGALSRSPDGRRLALLGYQSVPGTASMALNGLPRVVALVDAADFGPSPSIETNTTIGTVYSVTAPRGAVVNGTNVWLAGGTSGVFLTAPGSSSAPVSIATVPGSLRTIGIFNGDLYVTSGTAPAGLYQIGTGLPLVSTTSTLVVATTSPYSFAVFDLNPSEPGADTIYLVDDSGGGGIKRFTRTGGVWGTTASATLGPPVRQAACLLDGADVVCVASSSTTLYRLRDVNAALPSSQSALTVIGSAFPNMGFRGITFAPAP